MAELVSARRSLDHDALLAMDLEEDPGSGWMVSYIDVMTLLVALFVLLLSLASLRGESLERRIEEAPAAVTLAETPGRLGIPMPDGALTARQPLRMPGEKAPVGQEGTLSRQAIVIALGVAGRVASPVADETPSPVVQPPPRLEPEAIAVATRLAEEWAAHSPGAELPSLEGVEVSHVAEGISLRVEDHLLFSSAEAELTGSGRRMIERLAEIIQRYDGVVSVEGHSDSQPINTPRFPSNWELSSARATSILRHLIAAGVEETRLKSVGFGATRPQESNATPEGRERNRRVEVIIHLP